MFPSQCTLLTELHNDATTEYTIINRPKQKLPPPLPPPPPGHKIYRSRAAEIPGRSEENAAWKENVKKGFARMLLVLLFMCGDKVVACGLVVDIGDSGQKKWWDLILD